MGHPRTKPKYLASKLLALRHGLGLSQMKLAERLELTAYHRVSEYESGRREPNLLLLLRYAKVADISTDVLIDDDAELPNIEPT